MDVGHAVKIYVKTGTDLGLVSSNAIKALRRGLKKGGTTEIYSYKFKGENGSVTFTRGRGIEVALNELHDTMEDQVTTDCVPIRKYENYARKMGVDEKLCDLPPPDIHKVPDGWIFYLIISPGYVGFSYDEFKKIWEHESTTILKMRQIRYPMNIYKAVGRYEFHIMYNLPDAETADMLAVKVPITDQLGSQVKTILKTAVLVPPSSEI